MKCLHVVSIYGISGFERSANWCALQTVEETGSKTAVVTVMQPKIAFDKYLTLAEI